MNYYYYSALIYLDFKDQDKAILSFARAVQVPISGEPPVNMQKAYQKWLLLNSLGDGRDLQFIDSHMHELLRTLCSEHYKMASHLSEQDEMYETVLKKHEVGDSVDEAFAKLMASKGTMDQDL